MAGAKQRLLAFAQSTTLEEDSREVDQHLRAVMLVELLQTVLILQASKEEQYYTRLKHSRQKMIETEEEG